MKKVLFFSIFLVSILTSKKSFAQTDSIYALDAKIENGELKANFLSTYQWDTLQIIVNLYDNQNKVIKYYIAIFKNNNWITKEGSYSFEKINNEITKYFVTSSIDNNILQNTKKVEFSINNWILNPYVISNSLFFLINQITEIEENDVELQNFNSSYFTLEGKEVNNLEIGKLYIQLLKNNDNIIVRRLIKKI